MSNSPNMPPWRSGGGTLGDSRIGTREESRRGGTLEGSWQGGTREEGSGISDGAK